MVQWVYERNRQSTKTEASITVINADARDDLIFNKVQSRSKLAKFV